MRIIEGKNFVKEVFRSGVKIIEVYILNLVKDREIV